MILGSIEPIIANLNDVELLDLHYYKESKKFIVHIVNIVIEIILNKINF